MTSENGRGSPLTIFINYRRADNPEFVKRIRDWFMWRYGRANVFMDFDSIQPFLHFAEVIRDAVRQSDVMVTIIGPRWLEFLQAKIDSGDEDFVRYEVGLALKEGLLIAPICIDSAQLPDPKKLPADVRGLCEFNAAWLGSGPDFYHNIERIMDGVEDALAAQRANLHRQRKPVPQEVAIEAAIDAFFKAFRDCNWPDALNLLEQIGQADHIPRSFPLDSFAQEVRARLELDEIEAAAARDYRVIRQLAEIDPQRAWTALEVFWESNPLVDTGEIEDLLRTRAELTEEARRKLDARFARQLWPRRGLSPKVRELLTRIDNPDTSPDKRAAAGLRLAELNDPRPGVGLRPDGLPDIVWVDIPGGEFIYQDNQRISLPTFYIARYPVTYAQFEAFVEAPDGFGNREWWNGLAERQREPDAQKWPLANHPREHVSWYAAVAFCRWLSATLNHEIRLPTEQEWEKAARGPNGYMYPWGNEYRRGLANVNETRSGGGPHHLGCTTAVGLYPHGVSPYGVLDMSGNVWEWCLNEYDDPARTELQGAPARVLRGGSWRHDHLAARTVTRLRDFPYYGYSSRGFRVCRI